jgi:hypothetical protein
MTRVGFETTIQMLKLKKTIHDLGRSTTAPTSLSHGNGGFMFLRNIGTHLTRLHDVPYRSSLQKRHHCGTCVVLELLNQCSNTRWGDHVTLQHEVITWHCNNMNWGDHVALSVRPTLRLCRFFPPMRHLESLPKRPSPVGCRAACNPG